jgi:hypothetical protein
MAVEPASKEFWIKVCQARDKLIDQFLLHPEVRLIDIGYDPCADKNAPGRIVLQIHLRRQASRRMLDLPAEIDGIPIRVLIGDYEAE